MQDKTAVVYFSKGGAARAYAHIIAEELAAAGHPADLIDLRSQRRPALQNYRNVVVGAGVRIGMIYRRARRLLRRQDWTGKRLAVFLASGIAVEDPGRSRTKFLHPLFRKYRLDPIASVALPGNLPDDKGKLQDNTDPERARQWARKLAGKLV